MNVTFSVSIAHTSYIKKERKMTQEINLVSLFCNAIASPAPTHVQITALNRKITAMIQKLSLNKYWGGYCLTVRMGSNIFVPKLSGAIASTQALPVYLLPILNS